MIKLGYSTFGLTQLPFIQAIEEVDKAGYPGIEISFHRDQFNPFRLTDDDLEDVKKTLAKSKTVAGCVATASHFFTPQRPHEPSLMAVEVAGRKRRIDLVKRGIKVARKLGAPIVSFGSGFIRDEHVRSPEIDPFELLVDSVNDCLREIGDQEDITLTIEPEPGMYIETMEQGTRLIEAVGSKKFRMHIDILHSYCSENDYINELAKAAPLTKYLHISDSQMGSNLKFLKYAEDLPIDLNYARYLIHFPDTNDHLFIDQKYPILFYQDDITETKIERARSILDRSNVSAEPKLVRYNDLFTGSSSLDDEIFVYAISVPGLTYDVLEGARPIIIYLRTEGSPDGSPYLDKMVANTITGVVHFHEIPGLGTLDFEKSFSALVNNGFDGYGSVELYHHVSSWQKALTDSIAHLSRFV